MAQLFRPRANNLAKTSIVVAVLVVFATAGGVWAVWWSPYMTRVDIPLDQPVPFSHEHHVAGLGIDCRYCHTTVEYSSTAGMPPTETCMTCHSQVWTEAPVLAPVRQSWVSGQPLRWNRVHDMPAFVFFNHGVHVQNGVGCSTCHGRVDQMPLVWKEHSMWMKWCLDCHSHPSSQLRPKSEIFTMAYNQPANQKQLGRELVKLYDVHTKELTDCSMCHR